MPQDNKTLINHYDNEAVGSYLIEKVKSLDGLSYGEKIEATFKYDQFHIGGIAATQKLLELAKLQHSSNVLDIGSGFGGVARYLAYHSDCSVVAVDLIPAYVSLAEELHALLDFQGKIDYLCADVRFDLPANNSVFDAAVLVHVGMNIENKKELFQSVHSKLKDHGKLVIYDLLVKDQAKKNYPVPWASCAEDDFSDTYENYQIYLSQAGFKITYEEKATDFSHNIVENDLPDHVVPLIGLDFRLALENLRKFLAENHAVPWFLIAEKM